MAFALWHERLYEGRIMIMDLVKVLSEQYMKKELPEMNVGDTVRVLVLVKEGKLLLFRQSAIVPDDMDEMTAIQYSARSLFLMERTVFETGNMLYGLLNGQVTLEEIKSASAAQ